MSALDRRELLVRAGALAAAGAAVPLLNACGSEGDNTATAAAAATDHLGAAEAARAPNIAALKKAVKGRVYTRSTPGFTAERTTFNSRFAGIVPMVVVRAASAQDVAATIKWASHYGVPITARSGGHSYAGYSSVQNGVVIDVRSLDAIKLGKGTAQIGAGNNLWSVYSTLTRHGVMVPGGSCPTVGIAGLTLGGGMGLAGRRYGLTLDNVKGMQIVTADGKIRNVSATSAGDLFWANRGGGGGNFGVVTAFSMQTHPAPACAWFYGSWPWKEAEAVLGAWLRFAPKSSSSLTSLCTLLGGGSPKVTAFGQYFGSESSLRKVLAPFLRDAPGGSVSYGTSSYIDLVKRWAGCTGESSAQCSAYQPQAFNAGSAYVSKPFSSAGLRAAVSTVERAGSGSLLFDCYGGAINDVGASKTAFAHRNQIACIQYYVNGSGTSWLAGAKKTMRPYVSSSAYVNYIDPTVAGYQTAYYGSNLPRLRQVKSKYDPHDLFRFKQSIKPAA